MAKDLRSVHFEECPHFFDDVRFAYVDEDGVGPEVSPMISFLSGSPELEQKTRIMTMFRLSRMCLDHNQLVLSGVKFGSSVGVDEGPDLVKIKRASAELCTFK